MTSNYMKRFSSTYFKNNANFDKNEIIMAKIFENEDDNKKKNSTRTSLGYYYQTNNYSHNYGTQTESRKLQSKRNKSALRYLFRLESTRHNVKNHHILKHDDRKISSNVKIFPNLNFHKIESSRFTVDLKYERKKICGTYSTLLLQIARFYPKTNFNLSKNTPSFFSQISPCIILCDTFRTTIQELLIWIDLDDEEIKLILNNITNKVGNPIR